jgi:hypothetical protein
MPHEVRSVRPTRPIVVNGIEWCAARHQCVPSVPPAKSAIMMNTATKITINAYSIAHRVHRSGTELRRSKRSLLEREWLRHL